MAHPHSNAGLTADPRFADDVFTMNAPTPSRRESIDDQRIRSWLELRRELAEMQARLEYLKLLLRLRAKR